MKMGDLSNLPILRLFPAYGRSYATEEAALADWFNGKDFSANPHGGAYTSIREWQHIHAAGYSAVRIQWKWEKPDTAAIYATDTPIV